MSGKKIGERYTRCFCEKQEEVRIGLSVYKYRNIIVGLFNLVIIFMLLKNASLASVGVAFLISLIGLLPYSFYRGCKRAMLDAGHTDQCSRRVARLATLYMGSWSFFGIVNEEKESK